MQVAIAEQELILSPKDFASSQDVKWCPGCGDYSILKQVQTLFPELGIPKENFVFIVDGLTELDTNIGKFT